MICGFRIPDSGFRILVPKSGFRFPGFRVAQAINKMAEEKLNPLDRKILSLDLCELCEFAPHAKVEKSAIMGKGKLSVIRAIRHKIEDSFENLTGDDQMEYVDELIAHLSPPPLEGMEQGYGQDE